MKKPLVILVLGFLSCSCIREEPGSGIVAPAVTALVQFAVYNTSVPEPSGLAYNAQRNSLMTVSDGNSTIYEIDFTGRILRSFVVSGSDLEGIALSAGGDTIYVVEERNLLVSSFLSNGTKLSSFPVNVATNLSNGLEGVALDKRNHLFVVNEKLPRMLLEYYQGQELSRKEITSATDLSDVFYEEGADCLWIVSDESKKVMKLSTSGTVLAEYSIPFPKGEGIAIVHDKIYIICDADGKMYVFQKPQ
jgi:uncharacterized protein YjiK